MNRIASLIAIGYVGLALVSAGVYAAATVRFVDHSKTQLLLTPGALHNGTFTQTPSGWSITLTWRFVNPGRLPITVAVFRVQFVVDNRSDPRAWDDPGKVAMEYTNYLSFYLDRLTGPVVQPGGTTDRDWQFTVDNSTQVARIAPDNGTFYVGILDGGTITYYVSDVNVHHRRAVPSSYVGV